jgi:CheY-like chemotaxis protein
MNVLIVDDNEDNLFILKRFISVQRDDCVVFEAEDGYEAIEQFEQNQIDVIIIDFNMPGLTGIETLSLIDKEHGGIGDTKTYLLTAMDCDCLEKLVENNNLLIKCFHKPCTKKMLKEILE